MALILEECLLRHMSGKGQNFESQQAAHDQSSFH